MSLGISYAGYRNAFPFPVEHATAADQVGAGTRYPVGMSLAHAAEIYWRWEKFKVWISVADNDFYDPPYEGDEDLKRSFYRVSEIVNEPDEPDVQPSESQLVGAVTLGLDYNYLSIEDAGFMAFDTTTRQDFAWIGDDSADTARIKFWDGLYYPKIQYESGGDGFTSYATSHNVYGQVSPGNDDVGSAFTGKITMQDGTIYDVPLWMIEDDNTFDGVRQFELSCTKLYGYGGKFNTTTGARL